MNAYIALFYVQHIIKKPHNLAVIGSPSRLVGGWFVAYPTKVAAK
jgi:hypothetical protein